jgi:hypothetical protein
MERRRGGYAVRERLVSFKLIENKVSRKKKSSREIINKAALCIIILCIYLDRRSHHSPKTPYAYEKKNNRIIFSFDFLIKKSFAANLTIPLLILSMTRPLSLEKHIIKTLLYHIHTTHTHTHSYFPKEPLLLAKRSSTSFSCRSIYMFLAVDFYRNYLTKYSLNRIYYELSRKSTYIKTSGFVFSPPPPLFRIYFSFIYMLLIIRFLKHRLQ